jgi:hypothetical protein
MWANDINDVVGVAPCVATATIREDPEFCAVDPITTLDIRLQSDSPCVPANHPSTGTCGLIGAAPVGCGTVSVENKTWSEVRLIYR